MKVSQGLLFTLVILTTVALSQAKLTWKSTIAHDKNCYTQGFSFINDTHLLESCGLNSQSYFQIYEFTHTSNSVSLDLVYKSEVPFQAPTFLQGSVVFPQNNVIYMLTWLDHKVFRIDAQTYQQLEYLNWNSEGWGLTHNGTHMFVSDGSANIYLVDQDFNILQTRQIKDQTGRAVLYLNELQWVKQSNGRQVIYANVYMSTKIVKINFQTGKVINQFDGSNLTNNQKGLKRDQVINGIAYNPSKNIFLVTGKKWAKIYEIDFQ